MIYLLRRLGFYALAAWASVTLAFVLPRLMPGDPATALFARFHGKLRPEALPALRATLGFTTASPLRQYGAYLAHLARGDLGVSISHFPVPLRASGARHAILPASTVVLATVTGWTLAMRNTMVRTLADDHVLFARAKGLSPGRVLFHYAARGALLPNLAAFGMELGFVLGGSILTEVVFSYPGEGYLLVGAVESLDYPLLQGLFLTLTLGVAVGALVVSLGALVGIAAGASGGVIDDLLSLVTNVFLILPGLPLLVVLAAYLPAGPLPTGAALVVTGWAWSARVFRAQTLSLRSSDFVAAALVAGERPWRVIAYEIFPHLIGLGASAFIGATVYAVGAEVGLEFLGLGDLGRVSWGTALYWARSESAIVTGSWWTFVPAGVCLGLLGFALVLVNEAIDELGDPRLRAGAGFRPVAGAAAPASTPLQRGPRD